MSICPANLKQYCGLEEMKTWSTTEFQEEFEVIAFSAPYVVVKRKSDGVTGSLQFTHRPRQYFEFKEGVNLDV